ncbi:hypothetical protein [Alkalibacterium olivapovliticus]|uniref:GT2 family glycosyltransferase n=1 Tax=Alkalibacterium olivapovliticus TaxID=99907 RepID=A0A2T0W7M7_9LACT|nr:hypothetical protein [Alkalibacterium olivapovliticus]PRY82676.1 GT2 family glycosyltransferase [Alkalibacterium olivapovliticus]
MSKFLNIVINYANEEEVLNYATQLSKQSISKDIVLVVVNNKISEGIKVDFQKELEDLNITTHLFDPKSNLGYLNGAFFGYRKYINSASNRPQWIVISNTDIIINEKDFFKKFLESEYSEDIWCIAPSVYNLKNETYDNPKYIDRIPANKMKKSIYIHDKPILSSLYLTLGKYKAKKNKRIKKESQYAYAVQGCFFALNIEFMEIIKNQEYKGFLFGEENFIAELITKQNKKSYCNNEIEIIHNEKTSTGGLNYQKRAQFYFSSHKFIYEEFYKD